ncbi:MAG: MBL fold metallo-hydrolase [Gemmatimonadaceae bacterium]
MEPTTLHPRGTRARLISHDHADHFDPPAIRALIARGTRFVTTLGVGARLRALGASELDIVELDWWEDLEIGGLTLTATPARHFSGRSLFDRDRTLWAIWADVHLGPEQAVRAHRLVRGAVMLPVHWGLFDLALHGWTEPIERVLVAAAAEGARVLTPRPGELVEPATATKSTPWWPALPWRTVAERPVQSSGVEHLMTPILPDRP